MKHYLWIPGIVLLSKMFLHSFVIADASSSTPSNVDAFTPSMTGEDTFIQQSKERMNTLNEQNQNMIKGDQEMLNEGYDPNEIYPKPLKPSDNQSPHWTPPNGQGK